MSDIKNILSKLDSLSEQIGFRPGARDFSGQRIEPKFDISPVQDITPPMGAVGGTAKPRIKVQPGQSPRQAISQAQQKIPTLKQEIPSAKPSVDPYGRLEPKLGDMSKQQSFVGKRKDPGGPLPAASKSIEPTLEMNKFPGYLKGTDTAKDVEKKMVGMEEEMVSEYTWLDRATEKLKARDPYKTYEPDDQGFTFTDEQEKWLGGANRQDPDILKRMPGPKPPVSYFKNADDQRRAQQLNFGRQNLNTVRSAVGKEKLAPEKFPTTVDRRGQFSGGSGLTRSVSLDDPSKTTSALPSDFKANMDRINRMATAADDAGNASVPSSMSTPSLAPVSSAAPAATTFPVGPTTSKSLSGGKGLATGTDATAQANRDGLRRSSVGAGPGPGPGSGVNAPAITPSPSDNKKSEKSSSLSPPLGNTFALDTAARKNQMAMNRFNTSNMAENKHNTVNRLARKFENYIENKFGLVENNYIPKKKKI
jgi:hypothetical protein